MTIATLCYVTVVSVSAIFVKGQVDPVIEKVAMFILGAFVTIATGMYKEYFDRNDRQQTKETK
jgi:hypothetical protein